LFFIPFQPWKLLTILIGGNDLCQYCLSPSTFSSENYFQHLHQTLEALRTSSNRWIINLVGLFKVSQVYELGLMDPYCFNNVPHQLLCPCLNKSENRKRMDELRLEYNQKLQLLSDMYSNQPYFRVNYQPGLVDASIVPYNQTYVSKLDCFHPNACLNQLFAHALWNNMLEPKNLKSSDLDPAQLFWKCPSKENNYIQ
ncbi:hypothetical protein HMI55_002359, partial [Coelomomyces lativittatus]